MQIFLAVSYSSQVDASGDIYPEYRSWLERVLLVLENNGHQVFCAPRHDNWKINNDSPIEALHLDLGQADSCDAYMAFVSDNVSAGVQLELGYALARQKQIIIASNKPLSYINRALVEASNARYIKYSSENELLELLKSI